MVQKLNVNGQSSKPSISSRQPRQVQINQVQQVAKQPIDQLNYHNNTEIKNIMNKQGTMGGYQPLRNI